MFNSTFDRETRHFSTIYWKRSRPKLESTLDKALKTFTWDN